MAKVFTTSTTEALKFMEEYGYPVSKPTLIAWCRKYGIGKLIGSRWKINLEKLEYYLENGMES